MELIIYDPYLLHTKSNSDSFSVIGLQNNNILILTDDKFAERKEHIIHKAKINYKLYQ